jgi:type I restriction enzyme S subunit
MSFNGNLNEIVEMNHNGLLGSHDTWERVALGEVAAILNGFPFDSKSFSKTLGVPLVRIRDILKDATDVKYTGEIPDGYWISRGDLLVGMDGEFNCAIWKGDAALLNQRVCKISGTPGFIDNSFLHRVLGGYLSAINDHTSSITVKHLSSKTISSIPLPLPPLNEQRRIAAKLDSTLAAVDACRQRLDGVAELLKRFRQAVLAAATSGELTREWREKRGQVFDWLDVQLGDHAESMKYGTSSKSQREGEVPVLRMGNLQGGELDWTELVYTSNIAEIAKYILDDGDVLFNRTNSPELVGKTAIYRGERPAIYAGYLIRVRCRPSLDPEFLNLSLNSPAARDYCWHVKSDGVSQSNINAKKLAAYPFLLPSLDEQEEIVCRAQELFSLADQLEARLTNTRSIVDRLFRGELVPQDPSDEPASDLLEKLMTTKPNADAKSPRNRLNSFKERRAMSITDKESIKAAILSLKTDRFSFDELRPHAGSDYESLKRVLFELLEEPNPIVRQVFDQEAKVMKFDRIEP